MARVELRQVRKSFGDVHVVHGVNITVEDGEFCAFLGPSGCGKSTTLRMIAGLEEVTDGEIYIGPREVTRMEPRDRNIGMVFQNYALYPHKTVRENLGFGLKVRGVSRSEVAELVERASQMLGLEELLDRKPKQLSGGQMQRVGLGRTLVRDADVFLLDEPLSNLDAKLRAQMRIELSQLHRRLGKTMIYVTHDQVEAMTMADRILVMHKGEVQQVGSPLQIFDWPANLFVARFVGVPEMNLFDARQTEAGLQMGGRALTLAERLPANAGRDLTVGIRPDQIRVHHDGIYEFVVDAVEQLGTSTLLVGALGGARAQILTKRVNAQPGDRFNADLPAEHLHVFDTGSGFRMN